MCISRSHKLFELYTRYLIVIYYVCEQCDTSCIAPIAEALGCFCNISLDNYSLKNTDTMGNSKTK